MKATKKQLIEEMKQLERRYESLVWHARKSANDIATIEGVRLAANQLEAECPDETRALHSPITGDWTHGFNSGMLAATRLVIDALDNGIEEAYEFFPDLNT